MNKRVVAVLAIAVMFPLLLAADSFWEGSAAMGLYGRFPSTGFFGASNSFSANTMVQVENLENGRKVNVIITGRTGGGSLFLILSQNAAEALGISSDEVIRARVVLSTDEEATAGIWPDDQPLHPDPDVNPAETAEVLPSIGETAEATVQSDRDPSSEPDPLPDTVVEPDEPDTVIEAVEETAETDIEVATATPGDEVVETTEESDTSTQTLEPDTAQVADLDRVDPEDEKQPERTGVVEPQPAPPDVPIVSALKPVPEFDSSDGVAQLAAQDAPEIPAVEGDSALAAEDTSDTDSAYVSALQASPATDESEETPLAVIPPEPVFVAEEPVTVVPEAEDILAVSDLLPPPDTEDASRLVLSRSIDEPSPLVTSAETVASRGDGPWLTALMTAEVPEGKIVSDTLFVSEATDYPAPEVQSEFVAEIADETAPDVLEVSDLKDYRLAAEAPLSVSLLPEPVFRDEATVPIAEDILRISDLKEQPDVAELTDITVVAELPNVPEEATAVVDATVTEPVIKTPSEPEVVEAEQETEVATIEQADEPTTEVAQPDSEAVDEPAAAEKNVIVYTTQPAQTGSGLAALRSAARPVAVGVFADYTVTTELKTDAYYLQLGAFREPNTASSVAVGLSDTYPVTVYASGMNDGLQYKVMLGPLKRDESGALLREFRAKGYDDAFVRKGS